MLEFSFAGDKWRGAAPDRAEYAREREMRSIAYLYRTAILHGVARELRARTSGEIRSVA